MFENACTKTVSILHAMLLGADGACIDLGTTSLLGFVAMFVAAVAVLKIAGRFALSRLSRVLSSRATSARPSDPTPRDEGSIRD